MPRGRSAAGYLLETGDEAYLIDPGPGTLLRLAERQERARQAGVSAATADTISRVFLTHFHLDHHADLLSLLFQRTNPADQAPSRPLTIHAPSGFRRIHELWLQAYGSWITFEGIAVEELMLGPAQIDKITVRSFAAKHSAGALCLRFECADGVFAYSGDTQPCDGLLEACRDADLAIVECSFPDEVVGHGHMTPAGIRDCLQRANPRRMALTHFYPQMAELVSDAARFEALWSDLPTVPFALSDSQELEL